MSLNVWKDVSPESIQEQVSISLLITHLISGCSIWDFLVFLPRDWEIFKHRTCCRWGMLALYAGCRYLGFVAMAATLVFVDMFPTNFNRNLGTAFQMLSLVSLGTAFTVLSLRIALALSQAVMWAVAFASFPRIPTVWQDKSDHIMVSTVLIILSTELLLLGVIGPSTRRFRADHHLTSQGHTKSRRVAAYPQLLYQQGIHYFAIVWAAYLPAVVFDCMAIDLTGLLRFTIQYVAFCTTVVCACKAFRDMMISGACPTHEFLAVWRHFTGRHIRHSNGHAKARNQVNIPLNVLSPRGKEHSDIVTSPINAPAPGGYLIGNDQREKNAWDHYATETSQGSAGSSNC